jgi:hypothetical protein
MPSHSLHSRVFLLAHNLANPYLGREPKARVVIKFMSYNNYTNLIKKLSLFKIEQSGDGRPCIHS